MVKLYMMSIKDISLSDLNPSDYLSKERTQKMNRFRFEDDKKRCLAGGLLLCHVFGNDIKNKEIKYNEFKKPYYEGFLEFNLSHSGEYVLLATSKREVGCDIEKIEDGIEFEKLAKRIFNKNELLHLNENDNIKETFYNVWTLRESYMKLTGLGFNLPKEEFWFLFKKGKPHLRTKDRKEIKSKLISGFDGYKLAVCYKEDEIDDEIEIVSPTHI